MPRNILPFDTEKGSGLSEDELFMWISEGLKDAAKQNSHLKDYLQAIPIEEIGVPEYYEKLSRSLSDGQKNLIYPVADNVFIHIYSDPGGGRGNYIPIEPNMLKNMDQIMLDVEERLINVADELYGKESNEERSEGLIEVVTKVCDVKRDVVRRLAGEEENADNKGKDGKKKKGKEKQEKQKPKVEVTPEEFESVKYLTVRDKVGMGVLEPLLLDPYIEDISQSGVGGMFVEHKIFKALKSSICFESADDLDDFVLRMSEAIKKPVTLRRPLVDATLLDGSRINIVYGTEVARNGSNFSIRKFFDTPLSILELIGFGSISYEMAAYLSLMLENGMNMFVVGETASGKTTLMNAVTTFIPINNKIVSIEDTPELQVPHQNWLREVAKTPGPDDKGSAVTMFELLKAALRQRPNFIIVGEIRGQEGSIAFGAMQTGHAVMSTFHASNVEKVIQRLTGDPINIPKTYIDCLNIVVCQNAVKLPNGKDGRRATSISEIVGYDPVDDAFSFVEVFHWNQATDEFDFIGNKNSFLLEEKIAPKYGFPPEKRWKIYTMLDKRARILERLHKEKGVTDFYELLNVLARAHHEGIF